MNVSQCTFGRTKDGAEVQKYTLHEGGISVSVLTLGGTIQSILVPDRDGNPTDLVLGFDSVAAYEQQSSYFGAMIGRCANRTNTAHVVLGGRELPLTVNEGTHTQLHGGAHGLHTKLWTASVLPDGLRMECRSADGEEGYPGNLQVCVEYRLADGTLQLDYRAQCDQDTLCNLTNHTYFNLNGHASGNIGTQRIQVFAHALTPVDAQGLPIGETMDIEHTALSLLEETAFAEHWDDTDCAQMAVMGGYDHSYCIDGSGMRPVARMRSEETGIVMDIATDMPSAQVYSGNNLTADQPLGKEQAHYDYRHGFCFETQYAPDAIHFPQVPQPILKRGAVYHHTTRFRFSTAD